MNSPDFALILPLISALLYVLCALFFRRAADFGVGFWRTTFVANLISATTFTSLLFFGGTFHLELLWQPATVAALFMVGAILNFVSLDQGDVSLATPVLGIKIVLVAIFTAAIQGDWGRPSLWCAAILSTTAIVLLNLTRGGHHHDVKLTILSAGASATMFALFDVLVQKWAAPWGVGRFPSTLMAFVAMYSCCMIPRFPAPLTAIAKPAWPWLIGGGLLFGAQGILFISSVAHFRNATAANVVYSSRGLWSVVIVWLFGHWFGNREQQLGGAILRWRLIGAVLMLAAIGLVLV